MKLKDKRDTMDTLKMNSGVYGVFIAKADFIRLFQRETKYSNIKLEKSFFDRGDSEIYAKSCNEPVWYSKNHSGYYELFCIDKKSLSHTGIIVYNRLCEIWQIIKNQKERS